MFRRASEVETLLSYVYVVVGHLFLLYDRRALRVLGCFLHNKS
jgi:hypothetical protein